MAKKKSVGKQVQKSKRSTSENSAKIKSKGRADEVSKVVVKEITSAAGKISSVIKKSHVKESFSGSVLDAEKFIKRILDDSESLKKFVKIVRKSFAKNSKHKKGTR